MFNKSFYPTPRKLIEKMIQKIQRSPAAILEPSAGKGDIIEALYSSRFGYQRKNISAIEIDETLQATLRGNDIKVIDGDFLTYTGPDKFDLIIANPPFDQGDLHLLKAIDIMYRGEIVFLLNAETIKNPCTNSRKTLVSRLKEMKADIEYIPDAFLTAERPTRVEVALVYINIERQVEDDLFSGMTSASDIDSPRIERNYEVSTRRRLEELVAEYNQVIKLGTETIVNYYRYYPKVGRYIGLNAKGEDRRHDPERDMTGLMQTRLNDLLAAVRTDFWRRTLDLEDVRKRLTGKKQDEFEEQMKQRCNMDFTENNIRQFVLNLIGGYERTLTEAVLEVFDKFTVRHCFSNGLYEDNIHYFNGWKTNNAFKVNKTVIIPLYGGYGRGPFIDEWSGKWKLQYGNESLLRDIDIVMSYFNGMSDFYSIRQALENAFERGESRKIRSTFFTLTAYKKGTLHLTFSDDDILRRFNIAACLGKKWLPHDYGSRSYGDCSGDEQAVIDSFEGMAAYTEHLGRPLFSTKNPLRLTE